MSINPEQVWLCVEVRLPSSTAAYSGRCALTDYQAIVTGTYPLPFLTLEDVHWIETVWSEPDQRHRNMATLYGRDGKWKLYEGSVALRIEHIFAMAVLTDRSEVVRSKGPYLD